MNPRPTLRRLGATFVFLVLAAAAACGDGGNGDTQTADPTATLAPPVSTETATAATDQGSEDATAPATGTATPSPDSTEAEETPTEGTPTVAGSPTPTFEPSGDPPFDEDSLLTIVGLDAVYFGMTVQEAAEAADAAWDGLPAGGDDPDCYTITPAAGPDGISFTVVDGRIERVDITNPLLRTRSGAGVGSTEARLAELYGERLTSTPLGGGNRIEFVPADEDDRTHHLVFVTDGAAVTSMRGGRVGIIDPETPCGAAAP